MHNVTLPERTLANFQGAEGALEPGNPTSSPFLRMSRLDILIWLFLDISKVLQVHGIIAYLFTSLFFDALRKIRVYPNEGFIYTNILLAHCQ